MTAMDANQPLPGIEKLPPLPGAVLELLRSFEDDNLNTTALAKKIGQDPLLSARALKIANSPFYGVTGQISGLPDAVMVLGFSNVRSMALAASLTAGFPLKGYGDADPRHVWRHSFCCALCAQALARAVDVNVDAAFTAGILHDIGRIGIIAVFPNRLHAIFEARTQRGLDFCAAETEVLGFSHASFGARLLRHWKLPESLVHVAEFHHRPDSGPASRLTDLVHVADLVSHAVAKGTLAQGLEAVALDGAFIRLALTRAHCADLQPQVPAQLEALNAVLE